MNEHTRNLMNSVKHLACKGRFNYYKKNSFAYIQISDDFSIIPTNILDNLGYQQVPLMAKENSPRTHISALTQVEQRRTNKRRLKQVWKKWRGKNINFRIVGVEQWQHTSKENGEKKWICGFEVESCQIEEIRVELGWEPKQYFYNMHITLCEKPI
jgi:hypothetical protein